MAAVTHRIRDDFRRQLELLGYLANESRDAEEWNQGRWTEIIALIHQLLLRRNEEIGSALGRLRDFWGKEESPDQNPLSLHEEQNLLVTGLDLLEAGSDRQAFRKLQTARAANVWWRTRTLQLLHSFDREQPAECSAFQRVAATQLARLGGLESGPLESDLSLARQYEVPGVMLNEERERRLLDLHLPRQAAASPGPKEGRGDGSAAGDPSLPARDPSGWESAFSRSPAETMETIRRTPHMDLHPDAPVPPGAEFQVEIYADLKAARADELTQDIFIRADAEIKEFFLDVWLFCSDHFELTRQPIDKLRIHREEPVSNVLTFGLRARSAEELEKMRDRLPAFHKGSVGVAFSYHGLPCGRVSRVVALGLPEQPAPGLKAGAVNRALVPPPSAGLELRHGEPAPDMTVEIVEDEVNDGRSYHCKVTTVLGATTSPWRLKQVTRKLMNSFMSDFTKSGRTADQAVAALEGAGFFMFEASPQNFQKAFWKLIDAGHVPRMIQIVTEEPHFLWELMVPNRGAEARPPLGVEFAVARWVTGNSNSPKPVVPVSDSYVVAPVYPGNKKLKYAESESEMICLKFNGEAIEPADYATIRKKIQAKPVSLLHFACHGKAVDDDVMQVLVLTDAGEMKAAHLKGEKVFRTYFREKQPLVFLNACEVGRQQAALTGAGGFPAVMIGMGARAVIAPAWSVKDVLAHEVAVDFYSELENHPNKPLAVIFQEIRKKAYEKGEDTYAAYCFYGSPLATRQ